MSIKNKTPEPDAAKVAVGGASPCSEYRGCTDGTSWIVDYVCNEWWDRYAETHHEQWAVEIADMLMQRGWTVRVSMREKRIILGSPIVPNGKLSEQRGGQP